MKVIVFSSLFFAMICSCSENNNNIIPLTLEPNAKYTLTFNATWSAQTHPNDYPPGPHFSGLIGLTHNINAELFRKGKIASDGIKNMAELGSKIPLQSEIQNLIDNGTGKYLISGGGISPSPGAVSLEFDITYSHSMITVVSMIAPSPDWFIAVSDINLIQNNKWVLKKVVTVDSYDAGTDSGPTFLSADDPTIPRNPISEITTEPLAVNNIVAPMGTITFTKLDQ